MLRLGRIIPEQWVGSKGTSLLTVFFISSYVHPEVLLVVSREVHVLQVNCTP